MDRRKFLQQSGTSLGGFLASPQLGVLGALVGGVAATGLARGTESAPESDRAPARLLLRSGEPINTRGEPFGKSVSDIACIPLPEATKATGKSRMLAVLTHAEPPARITAVEFVRDDRTGRWRHDVASPRNRMWSSESSVAIDGMRLLPDAPAYRFQHSEQGIGAVACACALPWNTVLCGEDGLIEINPHTGSAIKRLSLGRIQAHAIAVAAEPGKSIVVAIRDRDNRLFRFLSHQRFESRQPTANASALAIGELEAADPASGKWVALTSGLEPNDWLERVQAPNALVAPITDDDKTFERELKLLQASKSQALAFHLKHEGSDAFLYSGPLTQ